MRPDIFDFSTMYSFIFSRGLFEQQTAEKGTVRTENGLKSTSYAQLDNLLIRAAMNGNKISTAL